MTVLPLAGRTVVVTRSRTQASALVDRLTSLGASVVELPVIAIADPPDSGAALMDAARGLASGAYEWVALTSSNAAGRLLSALGDRSVPASVHWAAVGGGTARALADGGIAPDLVPDVSVSEALAEAFPQVDPRGPDPTGGTGASRRVLFPRAETVRGALARGLRAKGWEVDEVVAYRTVGGEPDPGARSLALRADAVVFTSSSTVDRTVALLGGNGVPRVIATIGPITSRSVREAGLEVSAEAEVHTIDGVVEALVEALRGAGPDRRGAAQRRQKQ